VCVSLLVSQLFGCATASYIFNRGAFSEEIAVRSGFVKEIIKTDQFNLLAYVRFAGKGEPVTIYIEGDGQSWESRSRLSEDPTPRDPLVVELAVIDSSVNVAYLARPGQYSLSGASDCGPSYWSNRRFSDEVIVSMNEAVEYLKKESGASGVNIIGYSGGAAIGVLIAARRSDVLTFRTIAGNLDPNSLCSYHKVSRLDGSMDPLDVAQKVANVPQRHFIGSKDRVVPSPIVESFVKREGNEDCDCVTIAEGATHRGGWREQWKKLLLISLAACSR